MGWVSLAGAVVITALGAAGCSSFDPANSPDASTLPSDSGVPGADAAPLCEPNLAFNLNDDVWAIEADGSGLRNLTNDAVAAQQNPLFSPDGALIAYRSDESPPGRDVYVMAADGSGQTRVTSNNDTDVLFYAWLADRQVVYIANTANGTELAVANSDGSGRQVLAMGVDFVTALDASPTTGKILFGHNAGPTVAIYTINSDGTGEVEVEPGSSIDVRFAPDGSRISYYSFDTDIYVVNPDGTARVNLTSNLDDPAFQARWRHDSSGLFFMVDASSVIDIFTMDVNGTNQVNVTNTPAVMEIAPAASPDGESLAYLAGGFVMVSGIDGSNPTSLAGTDGASAPVWSPCP